MRFAPWVVRTVVFGGLGLLLLIAVGGRVRADQALARVAEVADLGTPGEAASKAQQAVSVWAGESGSVLAVDSEGHRWRVVVMVGPDCYEVAVDNRVSAHPGLVACPTTPGAGVADESLTLNDPRRTVVVGFLDAWLRGDPTADRFLADERPAFAPPATRATDVKVTAVYGDPVAHEPGARSLVTARADVALPGRTEALAWTFALTHGDSRWSIDQMAGGEVPSGDTAALTLGRTTPTTFEQGD